MNWTMLGLVMSGGALGAAMRFLIGDYALKHFNQSLPWGTLIVNLVGSFAAGYCYIWLETRGASLHLWRSFLIVGILGALTTYSALMLECLVHFRADKTSVAFFYLLITLVAGFALVWLGARTAEIFSNANVGAP
ncbi:MAG: fluoride efflux transporter CrcB [Arenimonas sp.]